MFTMQYDDGNHLFHYTTFEAAIKIVTSNKLKFGHFRNMNDVAESLRQVYLQDSDSLELMKAAEAELDRYQLLCFTKDDFKNRGCMNDALWGYYSEKGNGVCLVFNKQKIVSRFKQEFKRDRFCTSVQYKKEFGNLIFLNGRTEAELYASIKQSYRNIFFEKDALYWSHEKEYRMLAKSEQDLWLDFGDSLEAVILSRPANLESFRNSAAAAFAKLIGEDRTLLYTRWYLDNKEIYNYSGDLVWPILGRDMEIDI